MVVHLSVLIMNPSEKTTVSTTSNTTTSNTETSNATTSDNTTDQVTTQVIGDTEFALLNDFRVYNDFKTTIDDTQLHNVTESGWFVSVVLSQPYNSSLFHIIFYSSEFQEVNSNPVQEVFPATVCDETNFPIHLLDNFTTKDLLLSQMV